MADLEEAILALRKAVNSTQERHSNQVAFWNNLGNGLGRRYGGTGEMADLEESIRAAEHAVDSTPEDHPDRPMYWNNLGNKLAGRYDRTGEMTGLEESIRVAQSAVESTPEDHPGRAGLLNDLDILTDLLPFATDISVTGRTAWKASLEEAMYISVLRLW